MNKVSYDLFLNLTTFGVVKVADVIIQEASHRHCLVGFRYTQDYLGRSNAVSIDPAQLPLRSAAFEFDCAIGALPAFLDDYLPGTWGRKVLTAFAFYRDQQKLNANSAIDLLRLMGSRRIGALQLVAKGESVVYEDGHGLQFLKQAEQAAQMLDSPSQDLDINVMSLLYLASSGSGVGGARPKALISEGDKHFLAKFNRLHGEQYNNARVELACLRMAKAAGIKVLDGQIENGINGRDVLLLERFDIEAGARRHLISLNGLLKNPASQQDLGSVFRYNDIHSVLQRYSTRIEIDLEQLLLMMMFNRAICNTDDHERNFSLINAGEGYHLAPAYDMVPSLTLGQYHAAGFNYQQDPPSPGELKAMGKVFGLSKVKVNTLADAVIHALEHWPSHAQSAGVGEGDMENIGARLKY